MTQTLLRRAVLPVTAMTAFALGLSGCGAANESNASNGDSGSHAKGNSGSAANSTGGMALSGTLNGAGSTAQQAAMEVWQANFQSANPNVTVNYDPVGSGGGREQFEAGGLQFAGSDDYVPDEEVAKARQACNGPFVEFPVYISPIAVIYNLPGVSSLNLSPTTLGGIFAGTITRWNDPAIKADNPQANLPGSRIAPVHRSDESGTTGNFTDYLAQTSKGSWSYGSVEDWPVKSGEGAEGTSGVVAAVQNGSGTIGYADASQAGNLSIAKIQVAGSFVKLSAAGAAKTVDDSSTVKGRGGSDLAIQINRKTTVNGAYPIVLVSYHIDCQSYPTAHQAELVKAFETYVTSAQGQRQAAQQAGSAPISPALRSKDMKVIHTIAAKG